MAPDVYAKLDLRGQTGEEGRNLEGENLAKKEPENRVVKEGFLEEEDLNTGFEKKHGLAEGKGKGGPSFRKFHLDSYENRSRLLLSPGPLYENQISTLQLPLY